MITTIHLSTHDTTLYLTAAPPLTAGCRETVHLCFLTDTAWQSYTPRVAIWRDGRRELCQTVTLQEARATVPALLLSTPGTLSFSLVGERELSGTTYRKTSTVVSLPILPAAQEGEDATLANVASATATEADVLAGQTFYAGDAAPRVGSIPTYIAGEEVDTPDPIAIKAFDLRELGLDPIPVTAGQVMLVADTTDIIAAMEAGPVCFTAYAGTTGSTAVLAGYAAKLVEEDGLTYMLSTSLSMGNDVTTISLIVTEGLIMAVTATTAEIVDTVIQTALGGDY